MLIPTSQYVIGLMVDGTSGAPSVRTGSDKWREGVGRNGYPKARNPIVSPSAGEPREDAYAFPRPLSMMTENIRLAQNPFRVMHL
jgi:hypothetical protein